MDKILNHLRVSPVVPVFYHDDLEYCKRVLETSYEAGIRVFEFVNRGALALRNFEGLYKHKKKYFPDMFLGMGTIKTAEEVEQFSSLGAEFIVSPIINIDVARAAEKFGVFWIPGCMTPTEISVAESLGAVLIKLFPGDVLGANFLRSIKPLFPNLKFMPTGGVTVQRENVENWKESGVFSIGIGSKLFDGSTPAEPKLHNIHESCKKLLNWMKSLE